MYADDTILFFKADDSNCAMIEATLDIHDAPTIIKDRIAHLFGVSISTKVGKYLGTYVDNRMSDSQNYCDLVEKVNNKLVGWKAQTLSQVGRLTVIKVVLQPLNNYQMSHLVVPKKYCHQMDAACSNFFWGFRKDKLAMHLLNKNRIFAPKDRGGLGLRDSDLVNNALVTKQIWRMVENPKSLFGQCRVLTKQEFQVKNCVFLLKGKKKKETSVLVFFFLRGSLFKVSVWNKGRTLGFNSFLLDVLRSFLLTSAQNQQSLEVVIFQKPGHISLLKGRFLQSSEAIISRDVVNLLSSQNVLVQLSNDVLLQQAINFDRLMPQYVFTGTGPSSLSM
ncbi:putative RNA-directed DNA polymerase [Senna tora]|uniref:Putative RNA-directed DNA polymerase n=1 Tax=Senna tora TaxID=362788 RepID=A0A834X7E8_9FABA|nr:putative RNA-directed DNA polymerase [Senna tora]